MTYTYTLDGETPSKKNSRINTRSGRSFPSAQYTAWHNAALLQLARQERPSEPIERAVSVVVYFMHSDKRRRDSDNQFSSIMDLFTDARILKDDNAQIVRRIEITNYFGQKKPEAHILINEI